MNIDIVELPTGKLFTNNTDMLQVIFHLGDSRRIEPHKSVFIGNDGRQSNAEGVVLHGSAKTSEEVKKKYGIDPSFFFHPDTYRLKDAFNFAAEHKGHFSVCIIRDNSFTLDNGKFIGGCGDILMASVIAKALKYNYGDKVSVWMKVMKGGGDILKNNPYIDRVFTDLKDVEAAKPDIRFSVNDLEFKMEMRDVEKGGDVLMNRTSIYLNQLELQLENKTPVYVVTEAENEWAKKELISRGYDLSKPIIGVQSCATNLSRTWSHTNELIMELKKKYQVIVLDEVKGSTFKRDFSPTSFFWRDFYNAKNHDYRYTMREVAAFMKYTKLVVTPNSLYFHLAGAMKHRCVALFGSTDASIWIEDYEKATALEIPCPVGENRKCWWTLRCLPGKNHTEKEVAGTPACLSGITVKQVMDEIEKHFVARKIAIVMLTYNCLEFTKKTVDSIRSFHDYELFVVDNASTDGTVEWLKEQRIKFVSKKCSVTWAQNMGITLALESKPDYIMILNNDVILDANYIDTLVETIERRKCAAVTGHIIHSLKKDEAMLDAHTVVAEGYIQTMVAGDFSAILLSPWVWKTVGGVDEIFWPRYQEDEDFLLRIRLAGGDIIKTLATSFRHINGTTITNHPEEMMKHDAHWRRNVGLFAQKWGFDPYNERQVIPHLDRIKARCFDWKDKIYIPLSEKKQ